MAVLVGKQAPFFHDEEKRFAAVLGDGQIVENYNFQKAAAGKYAVVFFYPLDFTFVCPSELIAFDHRLEEFKKRNVEVIGVSIDSEFTHNAWRNTAIEKGGIGQVGYTLVADVNHALARAFDVESEEGPAFRGTFLIDKSGVVRHQVVNDMPLGRNIDEALRMVDALQFFEEHGDVCPAGWNKGQKAMQASISGVASYLAENAQSL
ncbi:MAG: redoxin domain-containing protein [Paludibacterium sp.]|uniref:peroxiredoxin n=1 Tax=Paludibacterium sp. TaxID=1917523 RepID=UPI0025D5CB2C|nr:redoxin domain-containing protein [Paludibacterium sp.]MBV8049025.1 redoxin domain-containing protein [Paludibacterium sp.]MBV8646056.1 redoxin domain-containing protein [Paludibacterium sp.]